MKRAEREDAGKIYSLKEDKWFNIEAMIMTLI